MYKKDALKTNCFSGPFYRKGVGPVIAIALLLMVAVSSFVVFQNWHQTYSSDLFGQFEQVSANSVKLEYLEPTQLYVRNYNPIVLNMTEIYIGGKNCTLNGTLGANTIERIDLGSCLSDMAVGPKEVILFTENGIFTKTLMLKAVYEGDFLVSFMTGTCDAGYIRGYGLEGVSDSHAETSLAGNYTYNLCIRHNVYTLGTSCSGNYTRLFYLDGMSDAHAYTNNTSPYESDWHEVCVSVSGGGTINSTVNATDPQDGSICVGSMEEINNINGAHMGNCNAYSTKVWLNVG